MVGFVAFVSNEAPMESNGRRQVVLSRALTMRHRGYPRPPAGAEGTPVGGSRFDSLP